MLPAAVVLVAVAAPLSARAEPAAAPPDSAVVAPRGPDQPTDDLGTGDLADRDGWFFRGLRALVARRDPTADAAAGERTRLAREPFLRHESRPIHSVIVFGRKAFGELDPAAAADDTADASSGGLRGRAEAGVAAAGRLLDSLAPRTRETVIRNHLLFAAGDRLDPFALADSERLLRDLPFIQDVRIEVFPLLERDDDAVAVVVMVRDRWPWGARADIKTAQRWDAAVFHRNAGGLGLDLESQLLVARDQDPAVGWLARGGYRNLAGSFVDLTAEARRAWDRDHTRLAAARRFVHPDLRLVGGVSAESRTEYDHDDLPAGESLRTRSAGFWVGWGIVVGTSDREDRRRVRLVPAVGADRVDYRDPPRRHAPDPRRWRDRTRYLAQLNLSSVDYYTASLVYGYGETEDIPAGLWASLTGGYEDGEREDRWYHGGRFVWPRVTGGGRVLALSAAYGGFRRAGRFEDGVLDLQASGFGDLHRAGPGYWRHFFRLRYTLGVNQSGDPLRLDRAGLRDLDREEVAGNQRLVAGLESVHFTPYAFFGFKTAIFGYLSAGVIAERKDPLLGQRLWTDAGLGLRLNNPGLVLPTIELRAGLVAGEGGPDAVLTVRMGEITFLDRRLPGARPDVLPYR